MKTLNMKMATCVCGFLVLTLLIIIPGISYSQFAVQNVQSPQYLVEDVLLGNGVSVSNITYTGSTLSLGEFNQGGSSSLGLTSGIVLSTGKVTDVAYANTVPNKQYNTQGGGDPQLQALTPMTNLYDAAILEFDFIPTTDSVQFRYVFGSEEYPEWVGSNFNDVFGFFITGANPLGGQYNNKNIAVIPGTSTPISTNTINAGVNNLGPCNNCNLYIDNTNSTSLQFDGITTVLVAKIHVIPCQTYHIKIAIADGADHAYDSGVFLEANSFSSIGLHANTTFFNNSNGNTLNEGCDSAAIDFVISNTLGFDYWIPITYIGTAQNGIDCQNLPDSILIAAGTDSTRLYIHPSIDNTIEGIESLGLIIPISGCKFDTILLNIEDYSPLSASILGDSIYCNQDTISQSVNISGGVQPYNLQWNNGSTISSVNFYALQDTTIGLVVTDGCGNSAVTNKFLKVNPNPSLIITTSIDSACKGETTTIKAIGANNYSWYVNNLLDTSNQTDSLILPLISNTNIKVIGTNQYGCSSIKTRNLTVYAPMNLVATPTLYTMCEGDTAHFSLIGADNYIWDNNNIISHNQNYSVVDIHTNVSDSFWVKGIDAYSCIDSIQLSVDVRLLPQLSVSSTYNNLCNNMTTTLTGSGAINYQWWSNQDTTIVNGSAINIAPATSVDYYVKGTNLQGCSNIDSIHLDVYDKPNVKIAFPFGKGFCYGDSILLSAYGTDFYYWINDGNIIANNTDSIYFSPNKTTNISVVGVDVFGCSDTAEAEIHVYPEFEIKLLDKTVCYGESATATVISSSNSNEYLWNNGEFGEFADYSVTSPTQVIVTATDTNGCQNTDSAIIDIFNTSIFSISPSSDTICLGDTTLVSISNINVLDTFWWNLPSVWSSANNDSILITPNSTVLVKVQAIDTNGCSVVAVNNDNITINQLPNIQVSPSYAEVQPMSPFTINVSGGLGYFWGPVANILQAGPNYIIIATDTLTHFYVRGTDANGCVNYDTAIIYPRPQLKIITNYKHICLGDSTYIKAITNDSCSYIWNTGAITQGIWVKPNTTTTYSVTVVDNIGFTNTKDITISVYTKPHLTTNPYPVYVCNGGSTIIKAYGAENYSWYPSNFLDTTAGNTVETFTPHNTSYKLVGIDRYGCRDSINVQVLVVPNVSIHISNNSFNICQGESVNISSTGAYTYEWIPGTYLDDSLQSSVTATPDHDISYKVIGTSIYGCKDTLISKIVVRPSLNVTINNPSHNICIGDSVQIKATGATTYAWFPSQGLNSTTDSIIIATPNISTTYKVVGTNTYGCTDTTLTHIGVHAYPNININPTYTQVCPNDSVVLTAVGANSFNWYPSLFLDTNKGASVICRPDTSISYKVIGKNEFGCADTAFTSLDVSPLSVISTTKKHICEGDTVILSAYTNSNNPSYLWSNGNTASQITIVPMNSQIISLHTSLASGCASDTSLFINVESNPNVSINANNNIVCVGSNVQLNANGAVLYSWSSNTDTTTYHGASINVHQSTNTTYYVEGKTLLGCKDTASISIGVNPLPTITVSPNFTNICSGNSQLLVANGGVNYNWYPNIGLSTNQGDSVVVIPNTNMSYMVIGADSNGCKDTAFANFITLAPASISPLNPHICYGDSIQLNSISQNQPLSYLWSSGDTSSSIGVAPTYTTNYEVTLTYSAGCSKVSNSKVIVHHDSSVVSQTLTPQVCYGDTAILKASNGISFNWVGSGIINANDSIVYAVPTNNTWYKVRAVSSNSCVSQDSVFVGIYSKPPITLASSNSGACVGDSIQLIASGGNSYKWLVPNINTTSSSCFVTLTSSKKYKVVGYDYNYCRDTAEILVQAYPLPNFNISPSNIAVCPHDSILVHVAGNNLVNWNSASNISVVNNNDAYLFPNTNTIYGLSIVDSIGCVNDTLIRCDIKRQPISYYSIDSAVICLDDSLKITAIGANNYSWFPSPIISNTTNDTVYIKPTQTNYYYITGVSSDGCLKTDSIHIVVGQKPILSTISNKAKYCQGDSVILTANCSNIPSKYLWQNGDTSHIFSALIDSISTFKLIGISALGCKDSLEIPLTVYNRPNIAIDGANTAICAGDSINLMAIGDSLLSYYWSTGAQSMSTTITPITNQNYSLIGIDSNSCSDTAYINIYVKNIPNIAINPSATNICINDSIILNAIYQDSSLSLLWNTGQVNSQIIQYPQSSILYSIKATDSIGCSNIDSIFVTVNPNPQFSFFPSNPEICNGDSIILSIVSNNSSLNYLWGVGDTVASITVSPNTSTNYYAIVSDTNGCSSDDTLPLMVHPLPLINTGIIPSVLCMGDTATLEVTPNPTFTSYQWSNGDSSNIINVSPSSPTSYTITVTDTNSCSNDSTINLNVVPLPNVEIVSSDSVICTYDSVVLNLVSNIPLSNILWNTGQTTSTIINSPLASTNYFVKAIDTNGCTGFDTSFVKVNNRPICNILVDTFICQEETTYASYSGNATNTGIYHWHFDGSPIVSGSGMGPVSLKWNQAGNYKVYLYVDDFACTSFPDSVNVVVNPLPVVDFEVKSDIHCDSSAVNFINNNYGMKKYHWNFGDPLSHSDTSNIQSPSYIYSVPGTYDVNLELTSFAGCSADLTKRSIVEILPKPNAAFTVNTHYPAANHPVVNFYNNSSNYSSLEWNFGETASGIYNTSNELNPYHIYIGKGIFHVNLVIRNDYNCSDTAYTDINISPEPTIFASTAFTPNGDGLNEEFKPIFSKENVKEYEIYIYNRLGRLVYKSNDYYHGWNGKEISSGEDCEPDIFSYVIYITDAKDVKRKYTGSVTLLK